MRLVARLVLQGIYFEEAGCLDGLCVARRVSAHGNLVLTMQQCWLRAAEALAAQPAPEVLGALLLWQWALAGRAAAALGGDDEEDLFFEGGDDTRQFTDGLVRRAGGAATAC